MVRGKPALAMLSSENPVPRMTSHLDRITVDPDVFGGRPCIRGLRIRVKDILELLAGGASRADILADFPIWRTTASSPRSNTRRSTWIIPSLGRRNVRFLVDAQLPPALAHHLVELGHEAVHVGDVGLLAARDQDIWRHALAIGAVLVTKDEDFVTMRALRLPAHR
jgi:uncharacterized protein (DUF433 family)